MVVCQASRVQLNAYGFFRDSGQAYNYSASPAHLIHTLIRSSIFRAVMGAVSREFWPHLSVEMLPGNEMLYLSPHPRCGGDLVELGESGHLCSGKSLEVSLRHQSLNCRNIESYLEFTAKHCFPGRSCDITRLRGLEER